MSTFSRLHPRLQHAIATRLGWPQLRPVQEQAGAAILDGENAIVLAPTAGGKTEAALFPTLSLLLEREPMSVGALYVAPIKALLNNQEERLGQYAEMVGLSRFVWHGDTAQRAKGRFCKHPDALLMTTPESIEVMLVSPRVPTTELFRDLRIVVIDEVHAFAGTDRGAHLMCVLERLARVAEHDVQRVGLSATVGNPEELLTWLQGSSKRVSRVVDPPKPKSAREITVRLREDTAALASEAARQGLGKKSLFFCQSRSLSETVAERMRGDELDVFVHHSSVSLEERQAAEARFASGTNACIVCTSTLELGIDVGDLDLVFQANAPSTVSSFLQRMGRTGRRAGRAANTHFLCEEPAAVAQAVAIVELARAGWVERVPVVRRCWPVLVHQLLALTLAYGGVSAERCWELLHVVPDFSDITESEYQALVDHMKRTDYLFESGGLLSMGTKAERIFGRKNFFELYAVFSSPVLYHVLDETRRDVGSLEQNFVDGLVEQMTSFLLGGRAWIVQAINHADRIVAVKPAPRGKKPSWGGFLPQFLGFELCQRIRQVVSEDTSYPYADELAMRAIREWRDDLGQLLRGSATEVQISHEGARWWTFAGGRINQTLKYALEWLASWKITADNFGLGIAGAGVSQAALDDYQRQLRAPGFWQSEQTIRELRSRVPEYRLSKFQGALPDHLQVEMIGNYLLDFSGTEAFLSKVMATPLAG